MGVRRLLTATPVDLKGELITSMHLEHAQITKLWSKKRLMRECLMHSFVSLLWAARGARNPNLQVVITHASHVCSQHSFGLNLVPRVFGLSDQKARRLDLGTRLTSTKNEWNAQNAIWSRAFGPSITRNFITRVLTTQSTAMEQKRIKKPDRRLPNVFAVTLDLWPLVIAIRVSGN